MPTRRRRALLLGLSIEALPDRRGKHQSHARGSAHPRWTDRRMTDEDGYVKVRVGQSHPLADPNGYAYEHLVVWCAAGNPRPDLDHVLHHRNGDRADNRIENLNLLLRSIHNAIHSIQRGRDALGRFLGKKAAGRLLDGVEHNAYPGEGRS